MTIPLRRTFASLSVVSAIILLGGCATTAGNPQDPLEPFNRGVYQFNDTVDHLLLKPAAQIYTDVVPQPARTGVHNFFSNIRDILNAFNSFLQGRPEAGFDSIARLMVNTSFGLLGMIDVASAFNIPKHNNDFGLTLGRWGMDSGPYLVLPFFGPSDFRDAAGLGVDAYTDAQSYIFQDVPTRNTLYGLRLVDSRAHFLKATNILEQAALDPYTFTRDAYLQRRHALIHGRQSLNREDEDGAPGLEQNDGGARPSSSAADQPPATTHPAPADATPAPRPESSAAPDNNGLQNTAAPGASATITVAPITQAAPAFFKVWPPTR